MNQSPNKKVVIVGSSNMDLTVKTSRLPLPGETVIGGDFLLSPGGKGANQAVTVARLGANATFITRIGTDIFGDNLMERYNTEKMNCNYLIRDTEAPTGVALISVDSQAENCIVVAPGANARLSLTDIEHAAPTITSADFLLMQLEIPIDSIQYAKKLATEKGVKVILNPAPATTLPAELLEGLYLITPNRTESAMITGIDTSTEEGVVAAAEELIRRGVENVIVTLGSAGCYIHTASGGRFVPIFCRVEAVDTTAAGDVFNGALVVALSEEKDLDQAVRFASAAAAISVTRMGAQNSVPTREETDEFIVRQEKN